MTLQQDNETKSESTAMPRWARYVFLGGVIGLISSLVTLFVITIYFGDKIGLESVSCFVLGCAMTAMLSQPAGLIGILAGAGCGALVAAIVHHFSK